MAARSHGLSRDAEGNKTPVYRAWAAMKQRCYNPRCAGYRHYGGRGITVCDRWLQSFANFYEDMGDVPASGYSLDRVDNDKGYSKENCRWATASEQSSNQRDRLRVCRKTDALLLELAPKLHAMGFSMRNIAALFSVGKTTIERALTGKADNLIPVEGRMYSKERRVQNVRSRVRRGS